MSMIHIPRRHEPDSWLDAIASPVMEHVRALAHAGFVGCLLALPGSPVTSAPHEEHGKQKPSAAGQEKDSKYWAEHQWCMPEDVINQDLWLKAFSQELRRAADSTRPANLAVYPGVSFTSVIGKVTPEVLVNYDHALEGYGSFPRTTLVSTVVRITFSDEKPHKPKYSVVATTNRTNLKLTPPKSINTDDYPNLPLLVNDFREEALAEIAQEE